MITEGLFFFSFLIETYIVTSHLIHLSETVQMKGHNMFQ